MQPGHLAPTNGGMRGPAGVNSHPGMGGGMHGGMPAPMGNGHPMGGYGHPTHHEQPRMPHEHGRGGAGRDGGRNMGRANGMANGRGPAMGGMGGPPMHAGMGGGMAMAMHAGMHAGMGPRGGMLRGAPRR